MKNSKGLSLVELLVVLALLGIILLLVFSPFFFSHNSFGRESEKSNTISDARAAMDYLTREIRKADEIEIMDVDEIEEGQEYLLMELEGSSYSFQPSEGAIYKDGVKAIQGLERVEISQEGKRIELEISMQDGKDGGYQLSSVINIR